MASSYDRFARLSALRPARTMIPLAQPNEPGQADALASLTGGEVAKNRFGEYSVARQWYGTPEVCDISAAALQLLLPSATARALDDSADPTKWLFLDTETTGLCGGTALTHSWSASPVDSGGCTWSSSSCAINGEEHSVLLEIARHLRERPVLVTFNGKSFDWPLLETRYRMTRSIAVPSFSAHLDFLHPARQSGASVSNPCASPIWSVSC